MLGGEEKQKEGQGGRRQTASVYSLVTSEAVLLELRKGEYPSREAALELAQGLPLLETTPAAAEIVEAYVRHRLMPGNMDCLHLANANKYGHIRRVNSLLGLYVPVLATPLELLGKQP